MPVFIGHVLVTVGLIVLACGLTSLLTSLLVGETAQWLDRRSHERAQRIERDLAKTKKCLALVSQAQASLLDAHAHEAAVALILESYRASKSSDFDSR